MVSARHAHPSRTSSSMQWRTQVLMFIIGRRSIGGSLVIFHWTVLDMWLYKCFHVCLDKCNVIGQCDKSPEPLPSNFISETWSWIPENLKASTRNSGCLCEFHTMSQLKVHRPIVASDASVFWHSLSPVAMKTAPPPFSAFLIYHDGQEVAREECAKSTVVAPRCPTVVRPSHFPAAPDPWTVTPWPLNPSLTGHAFIAGWKMTLR